MVNDYSEDNLVEQPAIALFAGLGWETENCFYEKFGENSTYGRETSSEVVLTPITFGIGRIKLCHSQRSH